MSAVWQANWVSTVTPGGPVMQEGVRRSRPASCCPPRPRGVYRVREGPGSLNIPLSCPSPGRECATFFYRGICQGAPPVPLERREPTLPPLPPPSLPPTTTSELQRPCLSLTANRMASITVGTPTSPPVKWRCLELKRRILRTYKCRGNDTYFRRAFNINCRHLSANTDISINVGRESDAQDF